MCVHGAFGRSACELLDSRLTTVLSDGSLSSGSAPLAELKVLISPRSAADGMPPSRPAREQGGNGVGGGVRSRPEAGGVCAVGGNGPLHGSRAAQLVRSRGRREAALPAPACDG